MRKLADQKKEDKSYLVALALLLLSGFFLLLFIFHESGKENGHATDSSTGPVDAKKFEDKVNNHLFKTSQSIENSRQKMQIENDQLLNRGISTKPSPQETLHKLDFSMDPRAEALLKELGREAKEATGPASADEEVQTDLFESQNNQELSEAYKKEYARQFIENARKAGYIIKLNDDYKVISVRPIRKPAENMELFPSNGHGVE
ncbi:MAG: hypothetical protein ACXWRE_11170 [Pseudobdellovibrionaceae bacterium]